MLQILQPSREELRGAQETQDIDPHSLVRELGTQLLLDRNAACTATATLCQWHGLSECCDLRFAGVHIVLQLQLLRVQICGMRIFGWVAIECCKADLGSFA